VHVSHHKAAGRANWGRTAETLALVDEARREGLDVTLDVYPYTAGSTILYALLPPWAQEGGVDAMCERLGDRRVRERIVEGFGRPPERGENMVRTAGWDNIVLSSVPGRPELEGGRVDELAAAAGKTPADFAFDLIVAQRGRATMILHQMSEEDVRRVLAHEAAMIGSDGIPLPGKPHPRWAGTSPRVLGRYARAERVLDLAQAVRKLSAAPAERFGLSDRGLVAPGKIADLVVFDPETVSDRATFEEPLLPPDGISEVVVAGRLAVRGGELTGVKAGDVLLA
jgi:N-acyl-D-aspartate/D-glutamate deacylase